MEAQQISITTPAAVLVADASEQFPVDARRLWSLLGVKTEFGRWFRDRASRFGFKEGSDYSSISTITTHSMKPLRDYRLTLRMGQNLCMVEWTEKGQEARDYFISCEEKLKSIVQTKRDWHLARAEGKDARRVATDIMKAFIEYAKGQGSQSADKYFINFTRLVNQALLTFEDGKKPDNLRDQMNAAQLRAMAVAEDIVARTLVSCMNQRIAYKDAYQVVKTQITAYGAIVGKSRPGISTREYVGLIA